jgi:WD40 repeat protein
MVKWSSNAVLSGHGSDVLDLAWTRDSKHLVSVGMDRKIMIWQIEKKSLIHFLDLHEKFVQGVAVDPTFEHIISCSNDRTCRVWKSVKSRRTISFFVKRVLKRYSYEKKDDEENDVNEEKSGFRIFADESIPTFFRRPDFSPDG